MSILATTCGSAHAYQQHHSQLVFLTIVGLVAVVILSVLFGAAALIYESTR